MIVGLFVLLCFMAAGAAFLLALLYAVGVEDYRTSVLASIIGVFLLSVGIMVAV